MGALHVVTQGAELRLRQQTLEVWFEGQRLLAAGIPGLECVVIHGNVGITTPAIGRLLSEGLPCVFLSQDGRVKGRLEPVGSPGAALRVNQARLAADTATRLALARALVHAKVAGQGRVLRAFRRPIASEWPAVHRRLAVCESLAELRGAEGFLTKTYFGELRAWLGPRWAGWVRTRRPAKDGLNALLGYGYAILEARVATAAAIAGLDPTIGFLHEPGRPRPALVLDLMEEFRAPIVDFTVFRMARRLGTHGWWQDAGGEARLDETTKRELIRRLEHRFSARSNHVPTASRTSVRQILELQARSFARRLGGDERAYRPAWARGRA